MSFVTNTASDATALMDALVTFLTTDTTLTGLNQNWQLLRRDRYSTNANIDYAELRGKGNSNTDNIYVQLHLFKDSANDTFAIRVAGSQGWNSSTTVVNYQNQPGSIAGGAGSLSLTPRMPVFNNPIQYWFVANGRRFIVIAKSGSYWGSMYAGLILPYGTPAQYPYSLFIGANSTRSDKYSDADVRTNLSSFWQNGGADYSSGILQPSGGWLGANRTDTTFKHRIWPWGRAVSWSYNSASPFTSDPINMQPCPDNSYPIIPAIVCACETAVPFALWGELDGVFSTTMFGAAAGDTVNFYLPAPVQSASSTSTTGGTLAAGTYFYVITATNGAGETIKSNEVSQVTTGSASTITLNWAAVSGAAGYKVYRGTATGAENVFFTVGSGSTVSLVDTGSAGTAGTPPSTNTAVIKSYIVAQRGAANSAADCALIKLE